MTFFDLHTKIKSRSKKVKVRVKVKGGDGKVKFSDEITEMILKLLKSEGGIAEIQRNEFANKIGCVPSQIIM